MTASPVFPEILPKIRRLCANCAERDLNLIIEVDGGEDAATAAQVAGAGANAIVAGSAIFGVEDYGQAIAEIRASAAAAVPKS